MKVCRDELATARAEREKCTEAAAEAEMMGVARVGEAKPLCMAGRSTPPACPASPSAACCTHAAAQGDRRNPRAKPKSLRRAANQSALSP